MKDVIDKSALGIEKLLAALAYLCGRLLLALVALQFAIVLARYLFAVNFLWLQELAVYLHASIFMLAAAHGLVCSKHVRIDVVWTRFTDSGKRRIEWIGTLLLLLPMMAAILFASLPYVAQSWAIAEGSTEVSGLPGLFLLKTLLPVFAALMLLAGLLRLIRR
ncbi:MAG: TRAP transporter small permease subunit [Rhizobiaceae bacterium]